MTGPLHLKREIGIFGATALGVGAIIGSGIFIVTGIVAGIAGPAMILSIVLAGAIALLSAMSVAELSCCIPLEGGTYAFAREILSPYAGFIAGWIWVFSNIFVGAAVSIGFAQYFVTFFPVIPAKAVAVAICIVFIVINYAGLRESALLNNILVSVKVLILLFFIAFGLGFFQPANLVPFAPAGTAGILTGAALIFFAYTGFARVTIMAEEIKDPGVTIPHSIYLALGISTIIYILVSVTALGLAGPGRLAGSSSPLSDAIAVAGSPGAVALISVGAMVATASVLLTTILGISRIIFAMGRTQDLPAFLSRLHPRYRTPWYAITITGTAIIAILLFIDFTLVVSVGTFAMLVYYGIANVAALRLSPGIKKYHPVVAVLGVASCILLMVFLSPVSIAIGLAGLLAGSVYYLFRLRQNRPRPS
jgi:basic amino acid/polyamine antiporter, APA family